MIFRKQKEKEIEEEEPKKKSKKEDEEELVWDKKRIIIALVLILFLIIAANEVKNRFFPNTNILGESTTISVDELKKPDGRSAGISIQSQIDSSIEDVKESVNSIDPDEVATSSPHIQKVLRDIQSIKNLPTDKARNACMNICSSL